MTDVLNFLIMAVFCLLLILAVVIIMGFIYWVIWTALYIPINKKIKYDETVQEINREYNKIKVDVEEISELKESAEIDYRIKVVKLHELDTEKNKAEEEIKRKQELIKVYDEKIKLLDDFMNSPEGKLFISRTSDKIDSSSNPEKNKPKDSKTKKGQKSQPIKAD